MSDLLFDGHLLEQGLGALRSFGAERIRLRMRSWTDQKKRGNPKQQKRTARKASTTVTKHKSFVPFFSGR